MSRDWRSTQNPPSFKGVSFEVETDKLTGGRRVEVHEYPGSEFWDNEDIGRSAQKLTVQGYVFGDDADTQAQNLLAACTSKGAGLLVLPVRPRMKARCLTIDSDWKSDEMGRIPVTMTFIAESGQQGGIVSSVMFAGAVSNAADAAAADRLASFTSTFNSAIVPGSALSAAATTIGLAAQALQVVRAGVAIADAVAGAAVDYGVRFLLANSLSIAFQGQVAYRLDDQVFVDDQADTTSAFARVFADSVQTLVKNADNPADVVDALADLTTFQPQDLGQGNAMQAASVQAEIAMTGGVAAFVRQIALIYWAQAVAFVPYVSQQDAVTARATLAPAFYDELANAPDPESAATIQAVRDSAANYLTRNGAQLPKTVQVTAARGLPAAVLAAMLYNDSSMDEDLWLRNGPSNHPLFMPTEIAALAPNPVSD
jgi:prophage DNA circulation protein